MLKLRNGVSGIQISLERDAGHETRSDRHTPDGVLPILESFPGMQVLSSIGRTREIPKIEASEQGH